jgi:hypothetical protein
MLAARNQVTAVGRPWSLIGDYAACCLLWGAVAPAVITVCDAFGICPTGALGEIIAWPIVLHPIPLEWLSLTDSWGLRGSVAAVYNDRDGMAFFVLTALLTTSWLVLPTMVLFLAFQMMARRFQLRSLSRSSESELNWPALADSHKVSGIVVKAVLGCGIAISTVFGIAATAHWLQSLVIEYSSGGLTMGEKLDMGTVLLAYGKTGLPNLVAPVVLLMAWRLLRMHHFV